MTVWTVLTLGFMLGLRHATDADHVVAVSTIVSRSRTLHGAMLVGALWGLGHTLTILLVGGAIVVFNVVVPPSVETVLELCVAAMLIILGGINLGASLRSHAEGMAPDAPSAPMEGRVSLRPLFVGVIHGLAGSAAIALLVLASIRSVTRALLYLGVFGVGTIAGMVILTCVVVLPVAAATRRFIAFERYLAGVTGAASFAFGALIVMRVILE